MKRKLFALLGFLLIPAIVYAGTVLPPTGNTTSMPIAGANAGVAYTVKVDSSGLLYTSSTISGLTVPNYSVDASTALEASSVSKASAGIVCKFYGRIDSTAATATYYVQLMNASSLPANGAVTFLVTPIKIQHNTGTDSYFDIDLTGDDANSCVTASTGIVWDLSSTEFTKTISASNVVSATVLYK